MKKQFLILFSILFLISCSPTTTTDDLILHHFEYIPVVSVEAPNEFVLGETYDIKVTYQMPNSCYNYYNFDYIYQGESREIKTIAIVNDEAVCTQATVDGEYTISVKATQQEIYTFKFWQADGEYLTVIVPVI